MVVEIRWSHGCGKLCCQVVLLSWQMTPLVEVFRHEKTRHGDGLDKGLETVLFELVISEYRSIESIPLEPSFETICDRARIFVERSPRIIAERRVFSKGADRFFSNEMSWDRWIRQWHLWLFRDEEARINEAKRHYELGQRLLTMLGASMPQGCSQPRAKLDLLGSTRL